MNWTMGRYIGELDAEGRDRLIAAPEFSNGDWWTGECGCLVGTAMGAEWAQNRQRAHLFSIGQHALEWAPWLEKLPEYRYPFAVRRFGNARVVRAIKLRAAKLNGSDAQTIATLLHEQQGVKS